MSPALLKGEPEPYQRKEVIFESMINQALKIEQSQGMTPSMVHAKVQNDTSGEGPKIYDPDHPDADRWLRSNAQRQYSRRDGGYDPGFAIVRSQSGGHQIRKKDGHSNPQHRPIIRLQTGTSLMEPIGQATQFAQTAMDACRTRWPANKRKTPALFSLRNYRIKATQIQEVCREPILHVHHPDGQCRLGFQ